MVLAPQIDYLDLQIDHLVADFDVEELQVELFVAAYLYRCIDFWLADFRQTGPKHKS